MFSPSSGSLNSLAPDALETAGAGAEAGADAADAAEDDTDGVDTGGVEIAAGFC